MMLAALSSYHAGVSQVVIVGEPGDEATRDLRRSVQQSYLPAAIVIPVVRQHRARLTRLLPWIAPMEAREGRATAYVCRDFACQAPTSSPSELATQVGSKSRS